MERRQARRRTLRRRARWRPFWGIDVSSSDRCLENCPRGPGGAFARTQIRVAGHAVAHAAPATIWRDRNFAKPLPAPLAKSSRIAAEVSVRGYVVATGLWPVLHLSHLLTLGKRPTGPWLQIEAENWPATTAIDSDAI